VPEALMTPNGSLLAAPAPYRQAWSSRLEKTNRMRLAMYSSNGAVPALSTNNCRLIAT
jgi:hypothetical protein